MAFPTSDSGYFTITALSFSPSVIAVGESVSFSITIKNTSGKSVNSCYIRMAGTYPSTNASSGMGYVSSDVFLHGGPNSEMSSISWGNNVSKTFTGTFPFLPGHYAVDGSDYLFPVNAAKLYLNIVTNATFANGTNYENFGNLRGTDGEYLAILSKRDNPKLTFAVERTPNDESEKVKTSILLTSDVSPSVFTSHGYSANLYRSSDHHPATTADTVTSLDATIDQMLSGITDSTSAIATTLSNGSDWSFLLVVTNGYESNSATGSIPRAFANMHLSGCTTGGVAFGKFSASTENEPKFECMYPVYLYGGIAQIGSGAENPLFVVSGETISFGGDAIIPGFVTGGRTSIHLSAPVGKFMTNVNSVRVTALSGYIRNDGGYGMTSAAASSNYMGYAPSATIDRATNTVHIYIHRSSGSFYLTNNAALTYVPDVLTLVFE